MAGFMREIDPSWVGFDQMKQKKKKKQKVTPSYGVNMSWAKAMVGSSIKKGRIPGGE